MDKKSESKKDSIKKLSMSNLFFTQIVICMVLLIIFLIIRLVSNSFFGGLKLEYDKYFSKDVPLSVIQNKVDGYIRGISASSGDAQGEESEKEDKNKNDEVEETTEEETTETDNKEEATEPTLGKLSPVSYKSENKNEESESGLANEMIVPVDGSISSHYHYRTNPITGNYELHTGLDIAAAQGTDILAAMDGTVTASVYSETIGNYIIIQHSDRVTTAYGHCSKLIAEKGDKVKKGDVIALVGSTGNSTGPHCHFEIRIDGVQIDPEWVLDVSDMNVL